MKTTTRQLIRMLWQKDHWYQHYFFGRPWLSAIVHKQTGMYFYEGSYCIHLWSGTRGSDSWGFMWSRFFVWTFVIQPLAWRATRFARAHSYVPSEKEGVES